MKNHVTYFSTELNRPTHLLVKDVVMKDEDIIKSLYMKIVDPHRERDFIVDFGYEMIQYPNIPFTLQEQVLAALVSDSPNVEF